MASLTQRLYAAWIAQNGARKPPKPHQGGMGVMTPMKAQQGPASPSPRGLPSLPSKDGASRPDKRYSFISRGKDFRHDQ